MALVTTTSEKLIKVQYDAISELKKNCKNCPLLRNMKPVSIYVYSYCVEYTTVNGPAMFSIAKYPEGIYAIYVPKYLTHEQSKAILENFLKDMYEDESLIVFSKNIFDLVNKIARNIGITLSIKLNA